MIKQMPPDVWDADKLEFFRIEHAADIRLLSAGLSEEELLAYYGIKQADLSEYDDWFFRIEFNRGRTVAKRQAVDKLFQSMTSPKFGLNASIAYLTRFGDEWPEEGNGVSDSAKAPKTMRIIME